MLGHPDTSAVPQPDTTTTTKTNASTAALRDFTNERPEPGTAPLTTPIGTHRIGQPHPAGTRQALAGDEPDHKTTKTLPPPKAKEPDWTLISTRTPPTFWNDSPPAITCRNSVRDRFGTRTYRLTRRKTSRNRHRWSMSVSTRIQARRWCSDGSASPRHRTADQGPGRGVAGGHRMSIGTREGPIPRTTSLPSSFWEGQRTLQAEGVGFEPTRRGTRQHAFQACALGQTMRSLPGRSRRATCTSRNRSTADPEAEPRQRIL